MHLVALAWCHSGQILPRPLFPIVRGRLSLVCAKSDAAPDARSRLALLQSLFLAQIDHVPFAPDNVTGITQVLQHADQAEDQIVAILATLSGQGQIVLQARWKKPSASAPPCNGSSWLRARSEALTLQSARTEVVDRVLNELVTGLRPKTSVVHSEAASSISVLVDRNGADDALQHIRTAGLTKSAVPWLAISASGPWSPVSFAHFPKATMEIAA